MNDRDEKIRLVAPQGPSRGEYREGPPDMDPDWNQIGRQERWQAPPGQVTTLWLQSAGNKRLYQLKIGRISTLSHASGAWKGRGEEPATAF